MNKGVKHTEEAKRKISEAKKGVKRSPETCAKIAAAKLGKPRDYLTEEARYKMGAMRGKPQTEKQKRAVSEKLKGRKFSAEALANMKAAQQARRQREQNEKANNQNQE